jgi:aryl-alcohol dehydrogenase-like predicted oxidoreductase
MGGKTGASRFGQGVKESTDPIPPLQYLSERLKARPSQIAIAWLLRKSPVMLPIPGTSKVKHLEENASAALIELDDALMEELDRLSKSAPAEAT